MMRDLALDLAGDMLVNETAQIQFTFPRISRELQDVQHLRQQRHPDASVGDIIADSQ
jgi:hypothetical protein